MTDQIYRGCNDQLSNMYIAFAGMGTGSGEITRCHRTSDGESVTLLWVNRTISPPFLRNKKSHGGSQSDRIALGVYDIHIFCDLKI